jgi:hypothetical protein
MGNNQEVKKRSPFIEAMKILAILVFAFFGGYSYDINDYNDCKENNIQLELERDSLEIELFDNLNSADWNAMKNIETNTITEDCKRCSPRVSVAFAQIDTRKSKGRSMVVEMDPQLE